MNYKLLFEMYFEYKLLIIFTRAAYLQIGQLPDHINLHWPLYRWPKKTDITSTCQQSTHTIMHQRVKHHEPSTMVSNVLSERRFLFAAWISLPRLSTNRTGSTVYLVTLQQTVTELHIANYFRHYNK